MRHLLHEIGQLLRHWVAHKIGAVVVEDAAEIAAEHYLSSRVIPPLTRSAPPMPPVKPARL